MDMQTPQPSRAERMEEPSQRMGVWRVFFILVFLSFFLPACGLWSSTLQSPQDGADSQRRGKGRRERLESGQLAPSRTETAPSPHVQVLEPGLPCLPRGVAQLQSEGREALSEQPVPPCLVGRTFPCIS